MATMVDGIGFEELGDVSDAGSKVAQIWITGSITTQSNLTAGGVGSVTGVFTGSQIGDRLGTIRPVGIDNATAIFGYRVQAGSVKTGDDASGLIHFKTNFANIHWFMTITPSTLTNPYLYQVTDGSGLVPCISGIRNDSGCWMYGGSQTVYDWIAVGP